MTTSSLLAAIPPPPFQDLSLGPLNFRLYGLCIALGVLCAVWIGRRRWADAGGDPEDITTVALAAVPAGLVGARLYHVITDWSSLYSDGRWWPDALLIWKGGLGIPGGVLLGTLVGIWMGKRLGMDWRRAADAVVPGIPVAQAVGRLGNYFNQELFGRPTDLPWALEVEPQFRPVGFEAATTFHPTFAYEALWNLALAGLIVLASRRLVLRPGRWFAVYVTGYGLGRLWVESLRIDAATQVLGLRVNTWISLVAIVGGLLWLFWGGNPVDRDRTARRRAGEPLAEVLAMAPSKAQLAAAAAAPATDGPDGATDGPDGATEGPTESSGEAGDEPGGPAAGGVDGADPAPAEPDGADPAPAEPDGADPAPAEPDGADPAPAEPDGADPAPAEPDAR